MKKIPDAAIGFDRLHQRANEFVEHSRARQTMRDYETDWRMLRAWCEQHHIDFPPAGDIIALYFVYLIECGHRVVSVTRRISSFRFCYRRMGVAPPDLSRARRVLSGARREFRQRPRQARAFTLEQLHAICAMLGSRPIEVRNRTIIVLGFASGMRRAEIAALNIQDIEFVPEGMLIHIHRSKTDQEAVGRMIGVARGETQPCPVECLRAWIRLRGPDEGPLFCGFSRGTMLRSQGISGKVIHLAVRRAASKIGLDSKHYSGHSLRASFVTEAVTRGAELAAIMKITGHKRVDTLLRYLRPEPFALKQARAL